MGILSSNIKFPRFRAEMERNPNTKSKRNVASRIRTYDLLDPHHTLIGKLQDAGARSGDACVCKAVLARRPDH